MLSAARRFADAHLLSLGLALAAIGLVLALGIPAAADTPPPIPPAGYGRAAPSKPAPAAEAQSADRPAPPKIRWEPRRLIENLNEGIDVADVNNDGRLDIIAGPNWFEGPALTRHPLRDIPLDNEEYLSNNGDHAIDLNGDGWVDVLTASWFGDRVMWYENPGKAGLAAERLWTGHLVATGQSECEGTMLTDLDGDGTPELVVNSWDYSRPPTVIRIRRGTAGQAPTFETVRLGGKGTGHGIAIGDINGDGRPDLFVNEGWFEQPARNPWTTSWSFHAGPKYDHISLPGVITDLTGDGLADVIIGQAHDYGLRYLEQKRDADGRITWIEHEIDRSYSQLHCLVWTDLDGDKKPELIAGKRFRGHKGGDPGSREPVCLFRYVWDPAARQFTRDTITYDDGIGTGMQIRVRDIDGDGRPDIAVAGKTGTYVLFNRGPARP